MDGRDSEMIFQIACNLSRIADALEAKDVTSNGHDAKGLPLGLSVAQLEAEIKNSTKEGARIAVGAPLSVEWAPEPLKLDLTPRVIDLGFGDILRIAANGGLNRLANDKGQELAFGREQRVKLVAALTGKEVVL